MGIERFVEYGEEKVKGIKPAVYLKSGPRKGQIKEPAREYMVTCKRAKNYTYGITDAEGEETITLGYRFNKPSLALKFYAWIFHGAEIDEELQTWLDALDKKEEEKLNKEKSRLIRPGNRI